MFDLLVFISLLISIFSLLALLDIRTELKKLRNGIENRQK